MDRWEQLVGSTQEPPESLRRFLHQLDDSTAHLLATPPAWKGGLAEAASPSGCRGLEDQTPTIARLHCLVSVVSASEYGPRNKLGGHRRDDLSFALQ